MDEYIELEAVCREFSTDDTLSGYEKAYCREIIKKIPSADVARVRYGRWIYHIDDLFPGDSTQECSFCHEEEYLTLYNENYCPNCGCRMDGGAKCED